MELLKFIGRTVDNIWAIWMVIVMPLVGIILIQYFPLLTLGLIGLMLNYLLQSADWIDRVASFTGNETLRKRKYNCYTNAIILLLVTIGSYSWFIYYDVTHASIMCYDYTDWFHSGDMLPFTLAGLLQHVSTVSCPSP